MGTYKDAFFSVFLATVLLGLAWPKVGRCETPETKEKSLLWKVSGKGIKTSYLYGTFHLVPKDQFSLSKKVTQKLGKAETVVFEVDLDSPKLSRMISKSMHMAKPIESLMTAQDYSLFAKFVRDSLERNMQTFRYIKPAFLGQLLLYPKLLGYNPESYDLALLNLAKKENKTILSLESPEEQVALFEKTSLETQTTQLLQNIKQFDRQRKLMKNMLSLYQQEDLYSLYDLIKAQSGSEDSQNLLLNERNEKWMAPLLEMMQKSTSFVAVGAAHLPGEQGLIQLLRNKGYKVEPVLR